MTASNDPPPDVPVDQECIEIMYTVEQWLDHWQHMLSQPDGPTRIPAFVGSMQDLCNRLLIILGKQARDRIHEQEDEPDEYVPARDGVTH